MVKLRVVVTQDIEVSPPGFDGEAPRESLEALVRRHEEALGGPEGCLMEALFGGDSFPDVEVSVAPPPDQDGPRACNCGGGPRRCRVRPAGTSMAARVACLECGVTTGWWYGAGAALAQLQAWNAWEQNHVEWGEPEAPEHTVS